MKYLIKDLRQKLIQYSYRRWSKKEIELSDGYTILIPIPSDLPVFLSIALEIISRQDLTDLKEILVIPDWPSARFEKFCIDIRKKYTNLQIHLIPVRLKDMLICTLSKGITTRHYTQLVRGIDETHTKHALIHDADAFISTSDFLKTQYQTCRDRKLAVFGVQSRRSMVREDCDTFISTWEMVFAVEWAKSFHPYMHKGQFSVVKGRRQEFDTTLLPQYLTDASLIDFDPRHRDFYHFGYVIATYRNFLNGRKLMIDYGLKLFLIRLLIDVFDMSGWQYPHVPKYKEFLEGKYGLLDLRSHPDERRHIESFKETLMGIVHAKIFSHQQNKLIESRLVDLLNSLKIDTD